MAFNAQPAPVWFRGSHTNAFNYMPTQPLFQITLGSHVFPYHLSNSTNYFSFPVSQYQQFVILLCMLQWKVPYLVLFLPLLYLKESILFYFSPLLFPSHWFRTALWYEGFILVLWRPALCHHLLAAALPPTCSGLTFASYSFDATSDRPGVHPDLIHFLHLQFLGLGLPIRKSSVSSQGRVL